MRRVHCLVVAAVALPSWPKLPKIITGALGIFGVGVFAVPVGLIGAGFQEWVEAIEDKVQTLLAVEHLYLFFSQAPKHE